MNAAMENGYLSRPIHHSKCCSFFCNPDITEPLRMLIPRSALPLVPLEKDFAVDSTGFSVARHVRWHDENYGCERSGRDWVKAHVATGVVTNCITAAAIYHRDAADCPILPELVRKTRENFSVRDVSADKAYLSQENVETVAALGGQAFIAPKINTTGGVGGLFEKMFHYYQYHREDFMNRYHKRSNVESTFSAVKRLFGDHVRSKNSTAMVNEVLCKFICYNLTCVIHSHYELGIEEIANDLPSDIEDKVLESLRVRVREALQEHAQDPGIDVGQINPSQTNYDKVVDFLKSKAEPQTMTQILSGTKLPRGSLALVIYGKRKGDFVSEKTGIGKTLAWKLRNGS